MARQLEPRGPAGAGTVRHGGVGLVHRRGPAAPSQPLRSPDGRFLIVYDGEVYNHAELQAALAELGLPLSGTGGDAELLLTAWRQWGTAALDRCNGSFAFAVLDTYTGELVLARDPYGIRPLYLCADGSGRVAFGSDLRTVLAAAVVPRCPDEIAIDRYLRYGALDDTERTFFDRVSRLMPGELATVTADGQVRRQTYSRFYGELDLLTAARRPYDDAVQQHLAAELAAAARRRAAGAPVDLPESVVDAPPTDPHLTDAPAVPEVEPLLADLREFVRTQQEPVASPAAYAQFRRLRSAGARAALLDGDRLAAPAAGAGRWLAPTGRWYAGLAEWARQRASRSPARLLGRGFTADAGALGLGHQPPTGPQRAAQLLPPGGAPRTGRAGEVFQRGLAAGLRYADRNGARFTTTVRVPLLDPSLLRLLWSLGLSPITAAPTGQRRTERQWVAHLAPAIERTILSGSFAGRHYVDQPAVLDAYRGHLAGRRHFDPAVFWRLLNLELWLCEWIDRDPAWPPVAGKVTHHRVVGATGQDRLGSSFRRTSESTSLTSEIRSSTASPR